MKKKYNLEYFSKSGWSFVLIKSGKIIFKSKAGHLKPLISCINKLEKEMRDATVFDKIVGRAAAILLVHARVGEVWTPVVSVGGKRYLLKNRVKLEYKQETRNIMNRDGNDFCPMEKMSREMGTAKFIKFVLSKKNDC